MVKNVCMLRPKRAQYFQNASVLTCSIAVLLQEAQSVISKRNFDARAIFEQNTSAGQMRNRSSLTGQQPAQHDVSEPPASPTQHFSPAQQVAPTQQVSPAQIVSPAQLASPASPSKKTPTWPPAAESPPPQPANGSSSPVGKAPAASSPPAASPLPTGNGLPPPQVVDARNGGNVAVQAETQDAVYEDIEYTDDRGSQKQQPLKESDGTRK